MRWTTRARRSARLLAKVVWATLDRYHPILVHLIPIRRCNLACAYCNEYDASSAPVPLETLVRRIDRLAELGTAVLTFSGGEPLLHPALDTLVAHARRRGLFVTLITNGYRLTVERILRLNEAGLDHLQVSVDNVEPDETSKKSLRLLDPRLRWVAEHADFTASVNTVLGSGVRNPEDALVVARRVRELGLMSSLGIVHDGHGQLRPLGPRELAVYRELRRLGRRGVFRLNPRFQDNLALGRPNRWSCRAGARYLYVDEHGLVHYCSQQRGAPGQPLESYGREAIRREYHSSKGCAPFCTVNCVQQVGVLDNWRSPQPLTARVPKPAVPAPASSVRDETALVG